MLLAAHFNVCMQAQLICEGMNQAVRVTSSAFYARKRSLHSVRDLLLMLQTVSYNPIRVCIDIKLCFFLFYFDNELILISIEIFTHSYIHDKQWKYGKVKKSWTYISDFPNSYINILRQH